MTEEKISEIERLINSGVLNKSAVNKLSESQIDELEELLQRVEARCEKCGEIKPIYRDQAVCDRCFARHLIELHRGHCFEG